MTPGTSLALSLVKHPASGETANRATRTTNPERIRRPLVQGAQRVIRVGVGHSPSRPTYESPIPGRRAAMSMDPVLAKMLDLKFFHTHGYERKICPTCKDPFWTTDK